MNPLVKNPETGFLESPSHNHNRFDSAKKSRFLQLARDYVMETKMFPSVYDLCNTVGVSIRAFEVHCKEDELFAQLWDEVKAGLRSIYTNKLALKAETKQGIVANLAILKYLETGSFVDRVQLNHVSNNASLKKVIDAVPVVIDAELSPEKDGK